MKEDKNVVYKLIRFIVKPLFKIIYRPKIINAGHIPLTGGAVIAGNHKHALDPILVDICTNRVVYTLAKKELHDGFFGFIFRAIGSIPVDLNSRENKQALASAIKVLESEGLINVWINMRPSLSHNTFEYFNYII
jgi:1-acyl-sn-glycerol-3-phosphate acyltransferase